MNHRIKVLQFDASIGGCKTPIDFDNLGIAVILPCKHFSLQDGFIGNASRKALADQNA